MMKRNKDSVEQRETACQIRDLYSRFGVEIGALAEIAAGPSVSGYEFELTPDTKISKIIKLRDDISLMLSVPKVRLICPTPNKASFVIEVPNKKRRFVEFDEVFRSEAFQGAADGLRIVLGKDLSDEPVCFDLSRAPHLLIGGAACSGKTTLLKTILCSLILRNSPAELKLLLMAPEGREYEAFEASGHL
ncbi:MAG: hypothetical protein IJC26_06010 [Clostridia bacterium]|nr:hypothetical protein [Clostridia bacterium]